MEVILSFMYLKDRDREAPLHLALHLVYIFEKALLPIHACGLKTTPNAKENRTVLRCFLYNRFKNRPALND